MKKRGRIKKLISARLRSLGRTNRKIFDDIYINHRWGSNSDNRSSSGKGSFYENSRAYEEFVVEYIKEHDLRSVLDIGCGDFQVSGRILAALGEKIEYIGLDVSQVVIDRNTTAYADEKVKFLQLDATRDDLPDASLILVREVLQHLPNLDVDRVLSRLVERHGNAHILVTNTVAVNARVRNLDIPPGAVSRAGLGSGLWIDYPPFDYEAVELLRVPHANHNTAIVTTKLLGRKGCSLDV